MEVLAFGQCPFWAESNFELQLKIIQRECLGTHRGSSWGWGGVEFRAWGFESSGCGIWGLFFGFWVGSTGWRLRDAFLKLWVRAHGVGFGIWGTWVFGFSSRVRV